MSASVPKYLVRDVMKIPTVNVLPTKSVNEIARLMIERDVGSVVVVDENGNLLGIITKTDIVRDVVAKGISPLSINAGQIMTKNPYYAFEDTPLEEAASLMGSKGIGHLPILNSKTLKPVGMISKRDILKLAPYYIDLVYQLKAEKNK
ncbi:MAG: histidine kinase [Caldisphaera sp.]|uniref:CBS domain-containing protein n=1 Tax=Caldisphaera sp. TaxID=2060322 RepID=UPI000CADCB3E|nr:CBS domain-containing protein [Caldisphaera sp.]PMP92675.1 MAG: histidine kinase [Caldisphaera sp.]